MDHDTSEEMIPGHGRQQSMNIEAADEPQGPELPLGDERHASPGYDGFEDLTEDRPGTAGDY